MIFVTVGSQLPFERLIRAVELWATERGRGVPVFAQVGDAGDSSPPFPVAAELDPEAFKERVASAHVIVGHAGTGTIMASLTAGKPVVVLARREALGETRNDHQVATVERFAHLPGFFGAVDEAQIPDLIDRALEAVQVEMAGRSSGENGAPMEESSALGPYAKGPLVERLRGFFDDHLS